MGNEPTLIPFLVLGGSKTAFERTANIELILTIIIIIVK